jgi:Sec-independent protein secretion pathway component TatC
MAVPMWLFYFSAAALARYVIEPRRARRQRRLETQTG